MGKLLAQEITVDLSMLKVMDAFPTRTRREFAQMIRLRGAETVISDLEQGLALLRQRT